MMELAHSLQELVTPGSAGHSSQLGSHGPLLAAVARLRDNRPWSSNWPHASELCIAELRCGGRSAASMEALAATVNRRRVNGT